MAPESPRLLLTQGKVDRAYDIVRKIKLVNKEVVDEEKLAATLQEISYEMTKDEKAGLINLFSSKKMIWIVFLFSMTWLVAIQNRLSDFLSK